MSVIYKNEKCKICEEYVFHASENYCNECKIIINTLKEKNKTSIECVLCKKIKNMPCHHCNKLCCGACFGKNTINVGLSCDMMYNLYCAECKEFNKDI